MLVSGSTGKSALKLNAVASVLVYSAFIFVTLCLSAIALGVNLQEVVSNAPLLPPPTTDLPRNHR